MKTIHLHRPYKQNETFGLLRTAPAAKDCFYNLRCGKLFKRFACKPACGNVCVRTRRKDYVARFLVQCVSN